MTDQLKVIYTAAKDEATLDKQIVAAIATASKMKKQVQNVAVNILIHAEKCGDYSKANTLIDGLGNGVNCTALVEWFMVFGGLTVSDDGDCFDGWKGKAHIKTNFQDAKAKHWYTFKAKSPFAQFSLNAELVKLVDRTEKAKDPKQAEKEGYKAPDMGVLPETLTAVMGMLKTA